MSLGGCHQAAEGLVQADTIFVIALLVLCIGGLAWAEVYSRRHHSSPEDRAVHRAAAREAMQSAAPRRKAKQD
jgi:hypothetical protein